MLKINRSILLIIFILVIGLIYRFYLTADGNFLFHIDNARDMVDVREMAVLHKWRLIGPTSGVEGFYNGPAWYYIMLIPFLVSGGDPYSMILLEFFFWFVGGVFLLLLVRKSGVFGILAIGSVWVASNLIVLSSENSLSTNPVLFLMPLFMWLLHKSLSIRRQINYYWFGVWILAGLFFHLEMAFGFFLPLVLLIIYSLFSPGWWKDWRSWLGIIIWALFLLPQLLFDMRHQWVMLHGVMTYLHSQSPHNFNLLLRLKDLWSVYFMDYSGLLMNNVFLLWLLSLSYVVSCYLIVMKKSYEVNKLFLLSSSFILLSIVVYLIVPIAVMPWHVLAEMSVVLILLGLSLDIIYHQMRFGKLLVIVASLIVFYTSAQNMLIYVRGNSGLTLDPSLLKNELMAIDYAYQHADGQGFKAYVYLPSVIDYPYQYLFWWYGLKKYGYTPEDYAYLPNQPEYISQKTSFNVTNNKPSSNIIILIKEPDRINLRELWENNFRNDELIDQKVMGSLILETRKRH